MQKIIMLSTEKNGLRAEVVGWGWEDGDCVNRAWKERQGTKYEYASPNDVPVGLIGSGKPPHYPTVLHAIGDGWKLLAPAEKYEEQCYDGEKTTKRYDMFCWTLVKD